MPITELKTGHWYRWTGDKGRPSSFASDGAMDFILDGLPHKCIYGDGGCGVFEDSPLPAKEWCWYSVLDLLEDVTDVVSAVEKLKLDMKESERHITTEGKKFDAGKTRWDLVDLSIVEEVAKVFSFGLKKHGKDTWKLVPDPIDTNFAAMMRHIAAWQSGETIDNESGLSNLSHAMCRMYMLIHFERERLGKIIGKEK